MENEFDYVIIAYLVAVVPLVYLLLSSRKKYKKLKREAARAKVESRK